MKTVYISLIIIGILLSSCSNTKDNSNIHSEKQINSEDSAEVNITFKSDEDNAFDALDKIQISGSNLYSTFPNLQHDCVGTISTFEITNEEFENSILHLLNVYYPGLSANEKSYLSSTAAKAQYSYVVTTCDATTEEYQMMDTRSPPRKGMWIFQNLLDQRNLVINW